MATRQIVVCFLAAAEGGRRAGVPNLSSGQYQPHVVVGDPSRRGELTNEEALSSGYMLGVRFVDGPHDAVCGQQLACEVDLLYPGVDYAPLRPGVGILVVEGARIVATGNVLPPKDPDERPGLADLEC
jgi:hypothetical protein